MVSPGLTRSTGSLAAENCRWTTEGVCSRRRREVVVDGPLRMRGLELPLGERKRASGIPIQPGELLRKDRPEPPRVRLPEDDGWRVGLDGGRERAQQMRRTILNIALAEPPQRIGHQP